MSTRASYAPLRPLVVTASASALRDLHQSRAKLGRLGQVPQVVTVGPRVRGLDQVAGALIARVDRKKLALLAVGIAPRVQVLTLVLHTTSFSPVAGALVNLSLVEGRRERKRRDRKERWIERRGLG